MAYPFNYTPTTDFGLAERRGREVDGSSLSVELHNIAATLAQVIGFLRAGFTAGRKWQPAEALAMTLHDTRRFSASAGQTAFAYPDDATIDPATDKVLVYANGLLLDPSAITIEASAVTIPARTAGDIVVVALYDDEAAVRSDLASTSAALGASLIGIQDALGLLDADNVEDALTEVKQLLDATITEIGALGTLIRADGSVPFEANQSMGGHRVTNAADAIDEQDLVTLNQFNSLASVYGDLAAVFLTLAGGTMEGILNMGGYRIAALGTPEAGTDAANRDYVDTQDTALDDKKLSLSGTKDTPARGTLTGPASLGHASSSTADEDQTTDPSTVGVHTLHGVPKPGADDQVANKQFVDERVAASSTLENVIIIDYDTPTGGPITDNGGGSKTWVCPPGVASVLLEGLGGGGGGGGGGSGSGGDSGASGSAGTDTTWDASGTAGTDVKVIGAAGGGGAGGGGKDNLRASVAGGAGGSGGEVNQEYSNPASDVATTATHAPATGGGAAYAGPFGSHLGGERGADAASSGAGGSGGSGGIAGSGGGGGGRSYSLLGQGQGGAGGGAGAWGITRLAVTPGESYNIQIGAGGAGGSGTDGVSGGGAGATFYFAPASSGDGLNSGESGGGGGGGAGRLVVRHIDGGS